MNENQFVENKGTRDEFISRVDVLDRVGDLILLPNTEYATTEQVADYYGVSTETINTITLRNKEELESDGYSLKSKSDVISFLNVQDEHLNQSRGKSTVSFVDGKELTIPNRGLRLFTKRSILRVGMLLTDSEVAKEVRTMLLNVYQDAEQGKENIIENVVEEINEEKQLMLERIDAEMSGDFDKVCVVNAKLFALKNKRIQELEKENEFIVTNSLTITESRSIINSVVRKIAMSHYNGNFASAYSELYSKVNYKLKINIKSRKGEGLKRFTDDELLEVEKIVRSWALDLNLDLASVLRLSVSK